MRNRSDESAEVRADVGEAVELVEEGGVVDGVGGGVGGGFSWMVSRGCGLGGVGELTWGEASGGGEGFGDGEEAVTGLSSHALLVWAGWYG